MLKKKIKQESQRNILIILVGVLFSLFLYYYIPFEMENNMKKEIYETNRLELVKLEKLIYFVDKKETKIDKKLILINMLLKTHSDFNEKYSLVDIKEKEEQYNKKELNIKKEYVLILKRKIVLNDKKFFLTSIYRTDKLYEKTTDFRNKIIIFTLISLIFLILILSFFENKNNKLEKEKEILKKKNEEILKLVDEMIIISNTDLKGKITYVSKAFCEISGYKEEELIGKPHNIVRHPDMKKEDFKNMWEDLKNEGKWEGIVKNRKKDKKGYYYVYAVISSLYKDGKKIGYSSIRKDITSEIELKEVQNKLIENNNKLKEQVEKKVEELREKDKMIIQQSKLASMGELLNMISHQWKQPLSSINSVNQLIQMKLILQEVNEEELLELSKEIEEYVSHLSETILNFKNFYKKDKKKKKDSIENIINNSYSIIKETLKSNQINFIRSIEKNINVETYTNELKQVILNIVKNAEEILTEIEIENKYIKIKSERDLKNNKCVISIENNGGNIPNEIKDKIFEPYFSTKEEKNGTGIGLYMSKIIIEEHCEGKLSVNNTEDGVCFIIEIPCL